MSSGKSAPVQISNFVGGEYVTIKDASGAVPVTNPATGETIATVPLSSPAEIDHAVKLAKAAQEKWAKVTSKTRVQALFKLKHLMEAQMGKLIEMVVLENGKNRIEAEASIMKGIETLEWATAMPNLIAGRYLEVSRGVTCRDKRDPIGVVVSIVPFNFPVMVPFWTTPIAIACGNAVILKPSEKVPMTMTFVASLFKEAGIPDGIFQTVNGTRSTVEGLIDHPDVAAVSFVGSSAVAEQVARRTQSLNKRSLCLGGAKNHMCVVADADFEMCTADIMNSFAGSAGQRCMAASVLLKVGKFPPQFLQLLAAKAQALKAGHDKGEIGPVIDENSKQKILRYINEAVERDGAQILVDGRSWSDKPGYWVGPTILLHKSAQDPAVREEIFGPVLSVVEVETKEEAIAIENSNPYGNAAAIYTSVGQTADWFLDRFSAAMLGVNIGVPVPREPFTFGGMNYSNFGGSDITGDGAMEFFTQRKKITQKWVPPQGGDLSAVDASFIR